MIWHYREIIIAVITFLVIDGAVLAMNFYTFFLTAEHNLAINVAGRQGFLDEPFTDNQLMDSLLEIVA